MFGVCVYCDMVTCCSVFPYISDAVSDMFLFFFLYSHFVSFYFFVIVTSCENCVGKCWMICDNKSNMQRPLTSVSGMIGRAAKNNVTTEVAERIQTGYESQADTKSGNLRNLTDNDKVFSSQVKSE